jgi:hypothetical protein
MSCQVAVVTAPGPLCYKMHCNRTKAGASRLHLRRPDYERLSALLSRFRNRYGGAITVLAEPGPCLSGMLKNLTRINDPKMFGTSNDVPTQMVQRLIGILPFQRLISSHARQQRPCACMYCDLYVWTVCEISDFGYFPLRRKIVSRPGVVRGVRARCS